MKAIPLALIALACLQPSPAQAAPVQSVLSCSSGEELRAIHRVEIFLIGERFERPRYKAVFAKLDYELGRYRSARRELRLDSNDLSLDFRVLAPASTDRTEAQLYEGRIRGGVAVRDGDFVSYDAAVQFDPWGPRPVSLYCVPAARR